jgi:hypothetical protein
MSTMNVLDSGGSVVAVEKPLPPGRAAAVASRPVVLSTEDLAALTQAQAGTRVEGTITAGGTAQPLFGVTPVSGFEVINTHASEILYIRENGTASVADNTFNVPVPPRGSYTTPPGYKPTGDVSVVAATTGHAVIGRRW